MSIYYPPTSNFIQKTLNAQLVAGATASATLNNVTSIQNKVGVAIIDRVDANNVSTPNTVEVISFTGTSGSTITGLTRGLAGTSDQDHEVGAIVEFGPDITWAQGLIDTYLTEHTEAGAHIASLPLTTPVLTTPAITGGTATGATYKNSVQETLTTAGGTTTYTLTPSVAITAYATGQEFVIKMNATNTGASTINVSGLGAKSLTKGGATALSASDLLIDAVYKIVYDGTQFQVSGISSSVANALKSATTNVDVSAATAPSSGQVLTATASTTATWQTPSVAATIIAPSSSKSGTTVTTSGTTELTVKEVTITNPSTAGRIFITAVFGMNTPTVADDYFVYRLYFGTTPTELQYVTETPKYTAGGGRIVITIVGTATVATSGTQLIRMTVTRASGSGTIKSQDTETYCNWIIFPGASSTA